MIEPPPSEPSRDQRAFSHATGYIFQGIGVFLALGACCRWSFAGLIETPVSSAQSTLPLTQTWLAATPAQWLGMLAVVLSLIGGLALAALGLGLQTDRVGSGRAAKWSTGVVALFFLSYLGHAMVEVQAGRILVGASMAALWIVCFLLAGAAAEEQNLNPPSSDSQAEWTARDEDELRRAASPRPPDKRTP